MEVIRLALIDRDGTINVEKNYLSSPDQIELYSQTIDGIKLLHNLGLKIVIVTNQSAINRGYFDLAQLEKIHKHLLDLLRKAGAPVDAIYFCPHILEDACQCRKPATQMAIRAALDFKASLSESFVIGDNVCDIELGKKVGATTFLVRTGHGRRTEKTGITLPDYTVENLYEAAILIQQILKKDDTYTI